MAKNSNEKRAQLKQQCREAIVDDRLGLVVEPSKVRLQPPVEDRYVWSVTASHASLLKTCLSSGGELGRSLEAVSPESLQNGLSQAVETPGNMRNSLNGWKDTSESASKEEGSFTAKIRELEAANCYLRRDTRLESALDEGRTLRTKSCMLEREVETSMSTVQRQGEELARLRGGLVR
ncbi:uncharacterized protein N7482_007989 [Penicillium canariense]|uniref:Uncharacterized protein n=1 Tax=Penicillium canariense TaxID=189055 RepID=A0A9W9LKC3_9EURO|nr:uncharacterized protein N7482_007989 [Penicillium canariense]KAJ5160985.1 hypothetical protein N7482_007989 [Penicillium canariense]